MAVYKGQQIEDDCGRRERERERSTWEREKEGFLSQSLKRERRIGGFLFNLIFKI